MTKKSEGVQFPQEVVQAVLGEDAAVDVGIQQAGFVGFVVHEP